MHNSVKAIERDPFHVRSFLEGVVTETFLLEQLPVVNEEHVFILRSDPLIPLFVRFEVNVVSLIIAAFGKTATKITAQELHDRTCWSDFNFLSLFSRLLTHK